MTKSPRVVWALEDLIEFGRVVVRKSANLPGRCAVCALEDCDGVWKGCVPPNKQNPRAVCALDELMEIGMAVCANLTNPLRMCALNKQISWAVYALKI